MVAAKDETMTTTDSHLLPWPRYKIALARLRRLIADGIPLIHEDSRQLGDKYTHCSWGLCSRDVAAWSDAEDHLWTDQFRDRGRVAPKYRTERQRCPWDDRQDRGESHEMLVGCFYRCHIFYHRNVPTVEEALRRYDQAMIDADVVQEP